MLAELPKAGASGSQAPEMEGMHKTLGAGPSFFQKNGDLWNRVGDEGETEEERGRWGFGTQMAGLSGEGLLLDGGVEVVEMAVSL